MKTRHDLCCQGQQGDAGVAGRRGQAGLPGSPGLSGVKGDRGATGPQGDKGEMVQRACDRVQCMCHLHVVYMYISMYMSFM